MRDNFKVVGDLIRDTLQVRGKWSLKRLASVSGFYAAILYIMLPAFNFKFEPKDWAFIGLISFSTASMGMTVWNKKVDNNNNETNG